MKKLPDFFVLVVAAYAIYSAYKIITSSAPDFSVYYGAATYLLEGRPLYEGIELYTGIGYPPQTILLFVPFTFLPYGVSQGFWIISSLLSLPGIVWLSLRLIGKPADIKTVAVLSAAAFLMFPVKFTLGMGQSNLIALLLLLLGLYHEKNNRLSGYLLLGISTVLKPHFLFVLFGLLILKQFRLFLGALTVHGIIALLTAVFFGIGNYIYYFQYAVPYMGVFRGRETYYNQGLRAMVSRFLPEPAAPVIIAALSLLSLLYFFSLIRKWDPIRTAFILLSVLLLVEPLSWQHHYVFALPLLIYVLVRRRSLSLAFSYILIGMNLNLAGSADTSFLGSIIQSHAGMGNLLLLWLGSTV